MLRDPAWQAVDTLTRTHLTMFHALGDEISLSENDRRRALNLDNATWAAWTDFRSDGALPSEPPLPEMLRRLGEIAFNLSVIADRRC